MNVEEAGPNGTINNGSSQSDTVPVECPVSVFMFPHLVLSQHGLCDAVTLS